MARPDYGRKPVTIIGRCLDKRPGTNEPGPHFSEGGYVTLRIIKSTDIIPVDHPVFMIFGQPGICKSSLGYSMAEPLTLDFDKGAHRAANRRDTLVIDSWDDVEAITTEVLDPYSSVVVDTVGRCLDCIIADMASNPKHVQAGNPTLKGWGVLKNRFRNWISLLRSHGKDVLLIAHDKEEKDGDTRIVRPEVIGGSYGEVMKVSDFVGYVYMSGKNRVLDFNPTDRWVGKNPAGWTPLKVPKVEKAQSFLADLANLGREALGNVSQESAKIAQQVDDWRSAIQTFQTAEDFNRAIPEIKALPPMMLSQVSKLLMDEAKTKDIPFDKENKIFVQPAEQKKTEPAGVL